MERNILHESLDKHSYFHKSKLKSPLYLKGGFSLFTLHLHIHDYEYQKASLSKAFCSLYITISLPFLICCQQISFFHLYMK